MVNDDGDRGEDGHTVPEVTLPAEKARAIGAAAERARTNTAERDRLICEAHADGSSLREIAAAAGMHFTSVRKIIRRHAKEK